MIPLSEIEIPNVAPNEDFDRLKSSIQLHGLFHQVLLKGDKPPYKIIAGRQRFLAFKSLALGEIPARIFPESCPNPQEISLHENLRRKNLSWYEQVELEAELHKLRIEQFGLKPANRPVIGAENTGWSQAETAKELGLSIGTISQDLKLAEALQINPELRNIKDKNTALRLVKLAANRQVKEFESLKPPEVEMNKVLLGDSKDVLKIFPGEIFDVCLTDPPWSEYKDEGIDQTTFLPIFQEVYRTLKKNSFLFIVTSTTDWPLYFRELPKFGFQCQKYPIIWQKPKTITHGRATWQYARDFEPIMVAVKGSPSLTSGTEFSAILTHDNVHYSKMIHPHEKPLSLIIQLLQQSSYPGAKILDPFAGSGVVGSACIEIGRHYVLIELEMDKFKKIEKRLEKK
jgi:adenine-specific DNA-methyltransferase